MPTLPIPLNSRIYRNVDESELSDQGFRLVDGFLDPLGANVARPGTVQLIDLGLPVGRGCQGMYWWDQKSCAIGVFDNQIYKFTYADGVLAVTNLTNVPLNGAAHATFTQDGTYVFIANGGRIVYTDGSGSSTQYVSDTDVPIKVTHLAFLDGYILANDTDIGVARYSGNDASMSWDALDYFTPAADADNLTALHVFNREVYLFGPKSIEIWENDGTTPFAPIPGGILQTGCKAPYSIVNTEGGVYFFDDQRRLTLSTGRDLQTLSTDYDKELEQFVFFNDCQAHKIKIGGVPLIVFQFPGAGRTLVYNYRENTWCEWGYYKAQSSYYERWIGDGYCYCPDWNLHLVGSRIDGRVGYMTFGVSDDFSNPIRMLRQTGHLDWGTHSRKRSSVVSFRMKRGDIRAAVPGRDRTITLTILDDRMRSRTKKIDLGAAGDADIVANITIRGIYKTRQYSISSTAAVNVIIKEAKETFDLLR